MSKKVSRIVFVLGMVLLNIVLDQVSKVMVRERIAPNEIIEVLGSYFILTKVENTGAFLSLGSGFSEPVRQVILLALPAVILIAVLIFTLRQTTMPKGILLGLASIVGGGIGNLWDRTLYGSVTDFMLIDFDFVRTGIFNIADVSIMVGVGLVLVNYRHLNDKPKTPETTENPEPAEVSG